MDWEAIRLSLRLAASSVLLLAPLGILLAWPLAYGCFRGRVLLEAITSIPLVLPPTVLGFYLIVAAEVQGTGEQAVFSTGANNVVAQLLRANAEGWFPMACKVLETPSKSNPERSVQWLVKLDNF